MFHSFSGILRVKSIHGSQINCNMRSDPFLLYVSPFVTSLLSLFLLILILVIAVAIIRTAVVLFVIVVNATTIIGGK